jgi:mRNA interferase RelE/StbE
VAYTVETKRSAQKAVRAIPQKKLRQRVEDAIEALGEDPRPEGARKLSGTPKGTVLWRIVEGSIRIVYEVRDEELVVLVVLVGQREGVYAASSDHRLGVCSGRWRP